ncbi:hypothetical protein K503DRAFT_272829 [Rhizopogon vinicolor AM-OR11-026]|uniref:Uncharacterized protein n=1 Tax=Rhizopogon vinicolor AM-OR11-026 TaxID=1314800 RepID=A0A1B7NDE2_9AGAM|nr:hypothetical protein K503DRAFT_272829 [Rhizopogon vinicolor AM-OR11-026]
MEDRDDDKLSSSLPETLHAHIIRPDESDGHSDEASSSAQDRRPAQLQASRPISQFISSLTPATFPNSLGSRGTSSHDGLTSPDVEDSGRSTQRIRRTSIGRGGSAPARSAHPLRVISAPYGHQSPGSSEPPFYHQYPGHSYTFPPPPPSQFYVSSPSTFQWPEGGAGPSSHRARRPGSGNHLPEGCREGDDDDDFESTREATLIGRAQEIQQSRPGQEPLPPFFARDVTRSRENSPRLYSAPHCEFLITIIKNPINSEFL